MKLNFQTKVPTERKCPPFFWLKYSVAHLDQDPAHDRDRPDGVLGAQVRAAAQPLQPTAGAAAGGQAFERRRPAERLPGAGHRVGVERRRLRRRALWRPIPPPPPPPPLPPPPPPLSERSATSPERPWMNELVFSSYRLDCLVALFSCSATEDPADAQLGLFESFSVLYRVTWLSGSSLIMTYQRSP